MRAGREVIGDLAQLGVADLAARDRGHVADAVARGGDDVSGGQVVARLEQRPAFVVGVSRPADALLVEEVAREAGYLPVDDAKVREMTASAQPLDRGLVVGWVLAPK